MSYTKKTWSTGDVITADAMNNLEEGASLQPDYAQTDSTQPDYIKNKLVGKEVTYSDTLTWDGNTEGLESVEGMVYKITDKTPSMNDFASGAKLIEDSATTEIPQNGILQDGEIIFVGSEVCMISLQDNASAYEGEIILPSKGIWIIPQDFSIFSLTIPNYTGFPTTTIRKLAPEYLEPFEVVTKGGDTLTWDGDTSGLESVEMQNTGTFYRIAENVPDEAFFVDGFSIGIKFEETDDTTIETIQIASTSITEDTDGLFVAIANNMPMVIICEKDNTVIGTYTFNKGIYVNKYSVNDAYIIVRKITIPNGFTTTTKKLKGEYVKNISFNDLADKPFEIDWDNPTTLVENQSNEFTKASFEGMVTLPFAFNIKRFYKVIFDGVEYFCRYLGDGSSGLVGNMSMTDESLENTLEPFCILSLNNYGASYYIVNTTGTHTISIYEYKAKTQLPEIYNTAYPDTVFVLYTDLYLYKSINMTGKHTKLTKNELSTMASCNQLIIKSADGKSILYPLHIRFEDGVEYGKVIAIGETGDIGEFYTAEYTP